MYGLGTAASPFCCELLREGHATAAVEADGCVGGHDARRLSSLVAKQRCMAIHLSPLGRS